MISVIQNELSYRYIPLRELSRELAAREELSPLTFLKPWQGDDVRFSEHWEQSLKGFTINKSCDGYLLAFGSMLGSTDLEGQQNLCRHYRELFQDALKEAKEKKEKYAKLYTSLGCIIGVAAVVVFL